MNYKIRPMLRMALPGVASVVLVTIFSFCGYVPAQAQPIIYTISGVGSGSLGGNSFSNAPFTITAAADTSQIVTGSATFFEVPNSSASIFISGLGTATFTSTSTFANNSPGGVGISDASSLDILDALNASVFSNYN